MNSFEDIIGNSQNINFLKKSLLFGKISHAYIFDGIDGIGKSMAARAFAKSLLCADRETAFACGKCPSCKAFDSGNNTDFFAPKPKKANLGVDDIREQINRTVLIKPHSAPYKVYIVENADSMNTQAQNALLKTLEEPPPYVCIMLISSNRTMFLETILSRVVLLKFKPIDAEQISKCLLKSGADKDKAAQISLYAMGSIGRALRLSQDEDFIRRRESVSKIVQSISEADLVALFELYKDFEAMKSDIDECLDMLFIYYKDLLYIKETGRAHDAETAVAVSKFSKKGLFNILDAIESTRLYLTQNANFQLSLEMLLLKIKENT